MALRWICILAEKQNSQFAGELLSRLKPHPDSSSRPQLLEELSGWIARRRPCNVTTSTYFPCIRLSSLGPMRQRRGTTVMLSLNFSSHVDLTANGDADDNLLFENLIHNSTGIRPFLLPMHHSIKAAAPHKAQSQTMLRSLGLGLITGAADDDCSAIGTYAQAGAQFGVQHSVGCSRDATHDGCRCLPVRQTWGGKSPVRDCSTSCVARRHDGYCTRFSPASFPATS